MRAFKEHRKRLACLILFYVVLAETKSLLLTKREHVMNLHSSLKFWTKMKEIGPTNTRFSILQWWTDPIEITFDAKEKLFKLIENHIEAAWWHHIFPERVGTFLNTFYISVETWRQRSLFPVERVFAIGCSS